MRQFLEDAERESEKEIGADGSELNVKGTRIDSGEPVQCKGQKTDDENLKVPNKEAIKALRMLLEDFEDRMQYQDEVLDESTSEAEESPQRDIERERER